MNRDRPGDWVAAAAAALLRSWRFRIWAMVIAAIAGILSFVPLFWVLGFESSFVLALAVSVAAADLGAALVRSLRAARVTATARAMMPLPLVFRLWGRAAGLALALLIAPLAILLLNALRIRNCDFPFGFHTYAALPALSATLAAGLGVACGLLVRRRRRLAIALPYLMIAASAMYSLARFYAAPPVFSYNLFAGYFPGNLYDEAIALGAPLYWARLYQFALVAGILAAAAALLDVPAAVVMWRGRRRPERWRVRSLAVAGFALAVAAALKLQSGPLGFDIDDGDLERALASEHRTPNFIIHYSGGTGIEDTIDLIGEDHEFRLAQAVRTLGVAPPAPIISFYFADPNEKHRLMGARRVYMAKPWRKEIYLNHAPFPHQVLRHEIAHVVAGEFGDPIFGVSARRLFGLPVRFNVGLIEGLAVATDWPDHFNRPLTPHQSVKALTELGLEPPLSSLLSTGFLTVSPARSYTVAGSFVRFLYDRYGRDKVRELYRSGGDFRGVYDKDLAALEGEWRELIAATPLPPGAAKVVEERFRHRSIFFRECPHAVARARDRAGELIRRGLIDEAIEVMRGVCEDVPGEPRYLLDLAGLLVRAKERAEADAIYASVGDDAEEVSSDLRARAILRRAELAVAAGDHARALALIDEAASLPVIDDLARLAAIQGIAMRHTGPAGDALRRYFWGTPPERSADPVASVARAALALAAEPDSGLAHYLVGFNLRHRGAPADAARALERALELGLPEPLTRRECAAVLAEAAYMAGDLDAALRAAAILAEPDQPRVIRLAGADWSERVHWKRHGALPAEPIDPDDVKAPAPDGEPAPIPVPEPGAVPPDGDEGPVPEPSPSLLDGGPSPPA